MEIFRKKNEATIICFPMVTTASPEAFDTGETVTDTAYYSDAEGAFTTLAITDTVSEIGTTGMYEISLTAAEMNHDLIIIKFTSTNAADTAVLIRTRAVDIDDLVRSTTPANTLDVSATGEAGIDWNNVGTPGATVDLSATSINLTDTATTVTDGVTVTTNNDKTGYSLTQTFPTNFADMSITATTGLVDITQTAADKAWSTAARTLTAATNITSTGGTTVPQTGDSFARIGATGSGLTSLAQASVATETRLAELDAANLPSDIDDLNLGIIYGTTSGTPTTTASNTDLTGYADDELIGRAIIFTSGTADGQAARITDYASTNGVVTYDTLTTAPAASDTFKIV